MRRRHHRQHSVSSEPEQVVARRKKGEALPLKLRSHQWSFRFAALILLPLLVLGALEGILRLVGYGYPTSFFLHRQIKGKNCIIENDRFGWRFFGSAMARAPGVTVAPVAKSPETIRIFVLGESAAFGDPQPEFGLPRLLDVLLRAQYPGVRFEVVNAAMTAINSHVILPIARDCSREQGDIWVIYMGNNEVIGPYGAGSVFGAPAAKLGLTRSAITLKATKSGQLLESVLQSFLPGLRHQEEWGGMRMFTNHKLRHDDSRLAMVHANFQRNLVDILQAGVLSGTRMVVSTVAVNLKDCAPFASMHRPDLSQAALEEWNSSYRLAVESQKAGRPAEAIERFSLAAKVDDQFAELHFRWGQCCLALGQDEEARRHFTLARDYDTLRFRADSRINDLIRQVTRARENEGVYFVDSQRTLAQQSPHEITGNELFYEHVHLNFEGNYHLARAIAEQVARALPKNTALQAGSRRPWLTLSECAQALAWAGRNQYEATAAILRRVNDVPFTWQYDHAEQYQRLQGQLEQLRPALSATALRQAVEDCNRARARAPDDWVLDQNLSRLLRRQGDWHGAAEALRRVLDTLPHHIEAHIQRGILLAQSSQQAEAMQEFEAALRWDDRNVQALDGLGRMLAQQGKTEAAIRYYKKALKIKPHYCESLVNLGLAYKRMGKIEAAKDLFKQAIEHKPNNPTDLNGLAKICYDQGWYQEAVTLFTAGLSLDPFDALAHLHLGITLNLLGRNAEARRQYAEAVRLDPSSAEAHFRLGLELGKEGKIPEATQQFTEAVQYKPNFLEARANLGIALFRQGRRDEALDQLRAVLQLDPNHAVAKRYLQAIQTGTEVLHR